MKTTRSFLLLLMLLATSGLNAQKEEDKYAALVSEVRNEVWSLNLPDFKNTLRQKRHIARQLPCHS